MCVIRFVLTWSPVARRAVHIGISSTDASILVETLENDVARVGGSVVAFLEC